VSRRPAIRRLAQAAILFVLAALLVALPVTPLGGNRQQAQASVAVGDLIVDKPLGGGGIIIAHRKASDGSVTNLHSSPYSTSSDSDVSPDGSKIVYADVQYDGSWHGGRGIWVMNSDGSGQTQLTFPDEASSNDDLDFQDSAPRWSPNGSKIVFTRYHNPSGYSHVYSMNADGSNPTDLTSTETASAFSPVWHPDDGRIAYVQTIGGGNFELRIMSGSGSSKHALVNSCASWPTLPDWSPDGNRVYYWGYCSGYAKLHYITSTDDFATAGNSTETVLYNTWGASADRLRVSADGSYVYYDDTSGNIHKINTSSGSSSAATTGSNGFFGADPVGAAWPNANTDTLVALGDSVAAAEGILYGWNWDGDSWERTGPSNPNWVTTTPATDTDYEVCHQSGVGYANLLSINGGNFNVLNMACTGASAAAGVLLGIDDHEDPDDSSTTDVTAQLSDASGNKFDAHDADVVTLTLGANDVDFAGWIKTCYHPFAGECNTSSSTDTLNDLLDAAKDNMRLVLAELDDRADAANKTLRVLVTNYYNPFPSGAVSSSCIDTGADPLDGTYPGIGLTTAEKSWLGSGLADLNTNIAAEVTYAQSNQPNLDVDLVNISGAMSGHEFCTSDPWVYGPSIQYPISGENANPAPFHPTLAGQRAIRALVEAAI
jgi:hypothetical protein